MLARRTILATAIPFAFFTGGLFAQPGANLSANLAENARLLHQYTFKQRTEAIYKGEGKFVRVAQVHFAPDGKREMAVISQTGDEPATGVGHRIVNAKRDEMKAYVDRITTLVESYLPPDPERLRSAMTGAELGASGDLMLLTMKNYLKSGDSFSLAVDPGTRKLQRFELKTLLDKDPISVTADMKSIPNGPTYPGLTKVKAPAKELEIDISQFDFVKQ
jgi:azurin